jgi:uncharacterized repeat protein (TIGR03943 family)
MRNTPKNLPGRLDALLLLGLAGFMAFLLSGDVYWHYLHPRFMPVTAAAALVLAGLGVFALIVPPRPSGSRTLAFTLMLALALASLPATTPFGTLGAASGPVSEAEPTPGDEAGYLRLNTGELYDIAENGELGKFPGPGFALRGFVRRDPELDKMGLFGLYRVALFCCFADATAVGFAVRPPDGALPADGAWVRVAGRLAPKPGDAALPQVQVPGIFYTSTLPGSIFAADKVAPVTPPPEPFMFEWRQEAPFAY